jgi:hypothetical protein
MRTQMYAIIKPAEEGKLAAAVDQRHLYAQALIANIAAAVANELLENVRKLVQAHRGAD